MNMTFNTGDPEKNGMHFDFTGKVAIVTGAASGMGFLFAKRFASLGGSAVLCDINAGALSEKVAEITADGGKAVGVVCDVRKYEDVTAACQKALDTFGSIDVLLNTAGGAEYRMLGLSGEFFDVDIKAFDWSLDVNLRGQLYFDHAVMKVMTEQKSGVIINVGSITGEEGCRANVGYATSKSAAMNGLTKSVAMAGAPYGVRCVCVAPGPVLTRAAMANMPTPLGRAAEPEEVVNLMLYLASPYAAFITGENIMIDGGRAASKHC